MKWQFKLFFAYSFERINVIWPAHSVSAGISPALRLLSLFDSKFRANAEVAKVKVTRSESGEAVEVEFGDSELYRDVISKFEEARETLQVDPSG